MAIHQLEFEDSFTLIGIHTTEQDYRLAYLINKKAQTLFKNFKKSLDFKDAKATFNIFKYRDKNQYLDFYLIQNKFKGESDIVKKNNLFGDKKLTSIIKYLIAEKKNIDYFIKIEGGIWASHLQSFIQKLNSMEQIITAYEIDLAQLKSKDYLIF